MYAYGQNFRFCYYLQSSIPEMNSCNCGTVVWSGGLLPKKYGALVLGHTGARSGDEVCRSAGALSAPIPNKAGALER